MLEWLQSKTRFWELGLLALAGFVIVMIVAPERVTNIISMSARFATAAYLAYWIDRVSSPYSRPHLLEGRDQVLATMRRGFIQAGALVGAGMSL